MKTNYYSFLLLFFLSVAGILLTGCSKDDENNGEPELPTGSFKIAVRYGVEADRDVTSIEEHLLVNNPLPEGSVFTFPSSSITAETYYDCILQLPSETEPVNVIFYEKSGISPYPEIYQRMKLIKNQVGTSVKWKLSFDNKEVWYDCLVVWKQGPYYELNLYEDLTEYYQTLFPDANVQGVVRVLDFVHPYFIE